MINDNINNDTILVPKAEVQDILFSILHLGLMHQRLIELHEEESRLKKQHKAYLHIREYADEICEEDKKAVASILGKFFHATGPDATEAVTLSGLAAKCDLTSFGAANNNSVGESHQETAFAGSNGNEEDFSEELMLVPVAQLGELLEDLCSMGSVIDGFLEIFDKLMSGDTVSEENLLHILIEAEGVSDEVYEKWGELELSAIQ